MPPKTKFSKEDTLEAAFEIVRRHGWGKLSARSIAAELGSSTMPIYSNLGSMDNLEELIVKKALDLQLEYQRTPRTEDPILDLGLGYVLFAKHEPHLFRAIHEERDAAFLARLGEDNFSQVVEAAARHGKALGLDNEKWRRLVFYWWVFVHGLALMNNGLAGRDVSEAELAECIQEAGLFMRDGLLAQAAKTDNDAD